MASQPVRARRRRGSIWLGLGISAVVMLGRLGIHFAVADPPAPGSPEADGWNRMYSILQPLAFAPQVLFAVLFVVGLALTLIPRTRRTGIGVLIGVVVSIVVLVVLMILLIQGLSHASIEP
jgi:hypothetical protein